MRGKSGGGVMTSTTVKRNRADKDRNGDKPRKTAFISAPRTADTKALREILDGLGINTVTVFEAASPGRRLAEVIVEGIRDSDIIVALLGAGEMNSNVA